MLWKKSKDGKAAFSQNLLSLVTCDLLTHMALQTLKALERMTKGSSWRESHMYWKICSQGTCLPSVLKPTEESYGQWVFTLGIGPPAFLLVSVKWWANKNQVHPIYSCHHLFGFCLYKQLLPCPHPAPHPTLTQGASSLWHFTRGMYLAASHTRHYIREVFVHLVYRALASCKCSIRTCGNWITLVLRHSLNCPQMTSLLEKKKKLKIIFLQNFPSTLLNTNTNLPNAMSLECT